MNFRIHSFTHQINATRIKGIMAIRRSYLIRIREVQQFALRYYEKGRHDKCFKQVWKKYVFPRFGINYNTFLRYMKTDVDKLLGQAERRSMY